MSANERQVGGSHYQSSMQHWDFIEDNGIGYLEACATKYITRHRKKNGLQDLEKADHYVEKLIQLAKDGRESRSGICIHVTEFCEANNLQEREARICRLLFADWTISDLHEARGLIQNLIEEAKQPKIDNTGMKHPFGYKDED